MKRLIASIAILLILSCYLLSCEKDDLCAEGSPVTPRLVIDFYEEDNPSQLKTVTEMRCFVPGSNVVVPFTQGSRLLLPLKNDADSVKYVIQYKYTAGGSTISDTDYIEIKYKRTETYVSRACGFRTTFVLDNNTNESPNPVITHFTSGDPFISDSEIVNYNVDDENEAHINIFF